MLVISEDNNNVDNSVDNVMRISVDHSDDNNVDNSVNNCW